MPYLKGFTLIELMMIVLILGLISALAYPRINFNLTSKTPLTQSLSQELNLLRWQAMHDPQSQYSLKVDLKRRALYKRQATYANPANADPEYLYQNIPEHLNIAFLDAKSKAPLNQDSFIFSFTSLGFPKLNTPKGIPPIIKINEKHCFDTWQD